MALEFEWDARKATINVRKHGVSFEEAVTVFADPLSLTIVDVEHSFAEERQIILGTSARGRLLVVVFTERNDRFRLISARKAIRRERIDYEEA